jgi:hypothetical protein
MRTISSVLSIFLLLTFSFAQQQSNGAPPPQSMPSAAAPAVQTATPAPSGPTLEDGTPVKLRIGRTVSSADAHEGETVDFEVLEEVKVGDTLIIPKGGTAWATVTQAQSKRRMGRGGKLDINIDNVRLIDGEKAALRAVKETKGGGHVGAMTGAIVATSLVFFPAAPFFLFMHGKDITIPKGTELTAYVNGNVPLDLAKFTPANAATAASASAAANATLEITSTPAGAEIELDGSFVGNAPSSLSVAAGDHTLKLTKNGFTAWEKKIKTSSGKVNITAELQAATAPAAPAETKQ